VPAGLEKSPVSASLRRAWSPGPEALWERAVSALALARAGGLVLLLVVVVVVSQ
jgi:hypothetical protein